eukprot:m.46701 g.46701  ORF g.46701 m.46701 type:complete len:65 (-) comp10398_c0_seq1:902-1096(-)
MYDDKWKSIDNNDSHYMVHVKRRPIKNTYDNLFTFTKTLVDTLASRNSNVELRTVWVDKYQSLF